MNARSRTAAGRVAFRWALLLIALFTTLSTPPAARAAFEAPDDDPARLALASSGPAWPVDGPAAADQPEVFGSPPRAAIAFSTLRWDAAPGLSRDGVAGSIRFRAIAVSARLARLSYAGYAETRAAWGVGRAVAGGGWGWGLGLGRESWSVAGIGGRAGWFFCGTLGYSPGPGLRAALRFAERAGAIATSAQGSLEIGATTDPLSGWRLGAGYETSRKGGFGRLKLGIECRPHRSIALRMGFIPSDETFSAGLAVEWSGFGIDIARRSHPRLGTIEGLAFRAARKS